MLIPALFVAHSVKSLSENSANPCDVLVFAEPSQVTEAHRRWMEQQGIVFRDDVEVAHLTGVAKFQERLSVATLIKLVLAETLAGQYDKILYLDADLTIHADVSAIFALDMGEFALAAVPAGRRWEGRQKAEKPEFDRHCKALGMSEPYRFINSGVLLIDVVKWNRDDLGRRVLDYIRRHADLCFLPDEHGLNAVLDGRQAEISPVWNLTAALWQNRGIRDSIEPAIIHYMGSDKPWKKYGYGKRIAQNRAANRLYKSFLKDSPWPDWLDAQWTRKDFRKNLVYELRLISRRIRRVPSAPLSRRELKDDAKDFRAYCSVTSFADVDQGIAIREGGRLRLNRAGMAMDIGSSPMSGAAGAKVAETRSRAPRIP
jgi:lipopolysaccharide biosynthesis glycosyltransferase